MGLAKRSRQATLNRMESFPDLGFLKDKMLVVFGCGYLGGEVARRAAKAGARVWGVTRNPELVEALKLDGVTGVHAELASGAWMARVPNKAEFAVNCVSAASPDLAGYKQSYIDGNRAIATWVHRGACDHFIYTSSTGVYAQGHGGEVDESAPLHGGTERTFALRSAEEMALKVRAGVSSILRLAGIYGPGRHQFLDKIRSGGPIPGRPDDLMNLIHRDDAAAAILVLLKQGLGGIFNLSDNHPVRREDAAKWVCERLGLPPPEFTGENTRSTPNRKIVAARIQRRTGWKPAYEDFRAGFGSLL
jgi:nucleoside-diphosphate-sugar epimerase